MMNRENLQQSVVIDCFPESLARYGNDYAIVAVDVFRATTTAITALVLGMRCFPAPSIEASVELAHAMPDALLAGELGGQTPYEFDLDNSPADMPSDQIGRSLILLSTSGTKLLRETEPHRAVYASCLRNHGAQAAHLAASEPRVALIGAGARGEFRDEDALCCAWLARALVEEGFEVENRATERLIDRLGDAPPELIVDGRSAEYLRDTGRAADIEFTLAHIDDVDQIAQLVGGELVLRKGDVAPERRDS
jgi:2-phosphosulfolactate phosphatase